MTRAEDARPENKKKMNATFEGRRSRICLRTDRRLYQEGCELITRNHKLETNGRQKKGLGEQAWREQGSI